MPSASVNILITGAGAPGAAGIIRCLQREPSFNVVGADANPNAVGRFLLKEFSTIPRASDPAFIDSVLALCREKNIHLVIPLVTRELIPLSQHKREFELAGAKLMVSSTESLTIANDKSELYQFLQWRGMELPEFRVVETVEQFKAAAGELGYPNKPICFKPAVSNGSRGFRIINHQIDEHVLLFMEKPAATYITFDNAIRILSAKPFPRLLVSEYLPGAEFSVDCLAKDGETIIAVPRTRTRIINGISVEGEFINDEQITQYCTQIIRELRLHGNIGIQLKQSLAGKPLLLEINPRVQGTISAALGAGVNLPVLAVKQELNFPINESELAVKWGTRFSRHWKEVFW